MSAFGKRLREFHKAKGTISQYESGLREPDIDNVQKLADVLGLRW